ncbi:ubiquitin-related modifier 1 [Lactarius quietus]|nr:ubiquitin-related modifier 1 [Lactarius quietus]
MSGELTLKVQFGGGLELLFSNQRNHDVTIPSVTPKGNGEDGPVDIKFLIGWLKENRLKERPELFTEGETVRPGILVLVNDTDWELEGEGDYKLKEGDDIVFISTLHGG